MTDEHDTGSLQAARAHATTPGTKPWAEEVPTALLVLADGTVIRGRGAGAAGTAVGDVRRSPRWVLCIGAEERGLRAKTRSQVDEFVAIPMAEGVESLNLSVSAGILLWELSRSSDRC